VRILVVDDGPRVLGVLERAFREHEVFTAGCYEEAVEVLQREARLDLVISDYAMPGPKGTEVLATARTLHPDAVRIILSASSPHDIKEYVEAGIVDHYLEKPFERSFVGEMERLVSSR